MQKNHFMKNRLHLMLTTLGLLIHLNCAFAQKEFWGSTRYMTGGTTSGGFLFKTDSVAGNVVIVHNFDSLSGFEALGSVIQAANGNIYGTTTTGGLNGSGTLFEYNPDIDSFIVKINLPDINFFYLYDGLIQASNGKIYFTTEINNGYLYEYDITANTLTPLAQFPYPTNQRGTLVEANGKIFGLTTLGLIMGEHGKIYEYNLTTHVFSYVHTFNGLYGYIPLGKMILGTNGLLYGTTQTSSYPYTTNSGTLYSFNPQTYAYTFLTDIPDTIGNVFYLTFGANNKIYGIGANSYQPNCQYYGNIFEYDLVANSFQFIHGFGLQSNGTYDGLYPILGGLLAASNSKLYGVNNATFYEYDYSNNTFIANTPIPVAQPTPVYGANPNVNGYLIEICRKPSYKYFYTDSFTICETHNFNYTVHSTNANSYQWNKNGAALATQTDSILNFSNIQLSDSGIYTCTMQNQCGQTETMNLVIMIDVCTGMDETSLQNNITIQPNPAHDKITISSLQTNFSKIEIINALGEIVLQTKNNSNQADIDVSKLQQGVYQVKIYLDKNVVMKKFVKE